MCPIIVRSTTGELQPILRKTSPNVPEALLLALLRFTVAQHAVATRKVKNLRLEFLFTVIELLVLI